jgi:hypothetical protein
LEVIMNIAYLGLVTLISLSSVGPSLASERYRVYSDDNGEEVGRAMEGAIVGALSGARRDRGIDRERQYALERRDRIGSILSVAQEDLLRAKEHNIKFKDERLKDDLLALRGEIDRALERLN